MSPKYVIKHIAIAAAGLFLFPLFVLAVANWVASLMGVPLQPEIRKPLIGISLVPSVGFMVVWLAAHLLDVL
jgi:hypothetical protein